MSSISHSQNPTPFKCQIPTDRPDPEAPVELNDPKTPEDLSEDGYIVYVVEYPRSSRRRFNPQAIVVTDPATQINRRYDVTIRPGSRHQTLQIVAPYSFKYSNGQDINLAAKIEEGILAPKPDALAWFEAVVQELKLTPSEGFVANRVTSFSQTHYSRIWVTQVLAALKAAPQSKTYWHPVLQPPS